MANKVLSGTANQGSAGTGLAADTGFRLNLHEVKYYEDTDSSTATDGTVTGQTAYVDEWQDANAVDPTKYINVWVTETGVAGGRVDHFPWDKLEGGESNPRWGWVNNWAIFPRDNYASLGYTVFKNFNTGDSLAHEFGHFLGMVHSFTGGCTSSVGDYIADTPNVYGPWRSTCRAGNKVLSNGRWKVRDSCTTVPGNDDVSNIMDYSYDNCRDHFTAGQAADMHAMLRRYKPKLYAHSLAKQQNITSTLPPTQIQQPQRQDNTSLCTTLGGPPRNRIPDGTECQFPFYIGKKEYNDCASIKAGIVPYKGKYRGKRPKVKKTGYNDLWCPTIKKYSKKSKKNRHKWGYCDC